MTGFTRPAFMALENILKPATQILKVGGRPPSLNFCGQLGLFLMWCCSRMRLKELCLIFACVPTSAHRYVKRMLQQAAPLLRKNDGDERISFPDNAKIARSSWRTSHTECCQLFRWLFNNAYPLQL